MKIRAGSFSLAVDCRAVAMFALAILWRLVRDVGRELATNWRLQLLAGVAAAVMKLAGWL
jgi:hypothetical protein